MNTQAHTHLSPAVEHTPATQRRRLTLRGIVQGVGLRPFVQRLATQYAVGGWVANDGVGVTLEIQAQALQLDRFIDALRQTTPAACRIDRCESALIEPEHTPAGIDTPGFVIRPSAEHSAASLSIPLDTAPCAACLAEFHNPASRRYRYPFISCPDCGPRWSILQRLPFDRERTSFVAFPPCASCTAEYNAPTERRYHHQAISCPACGPQLTLLDAKGQSLASADAALAGAIDALQRGLIVAIKSSGGFQLLVDALNSEAIERLRLRKQRPAKPLAVLFSTPSQLQHWCEVDPVALRAVQSPSRPIVLLPQRGELPEAIAPGLATVGALLPPSPLHTALCSQWPTPLVATSGNRSGEPLCVDNDEALQHLGDIADVFLTHNLAITHPLDDSVVRVIAGAITPLRCARGLAPQQLPLPDSGTRAILALGGHGKNSVAITTPSGILSGPYIGDLDSSLALQRFTDATQQLSAFANADIVALTCDAHPDYASSHWAAQRDIVVDPVQHHRAHFFSVMAEYQYRGPALGVCWDGSGCGDDGSSWGGEFLRWDGGDRVERVARLRRFALPGGDAAVREPRRQALAALQAIGSEPPAALQAAFTPNERYNLQRMLQQQMNSPLTSSAGRLIDVIAALLTHTWVNRYEADAAMQLETLAAQSTAAPTILSYTIDDGLCNVIDWQPMLQHLLDHSEDAQQTSDLAAASLHTLAAMIADIAARYPAIPVFLSGGVFQNRILVESTLQRLQQAGRRVYTHRQLPPNDSGLAVGQLYYQLCTQ